MLSKKIPTITPKETNRRMAIHEAGHAVAIVLGNQQKKLPPVYFQVCFSPLQSDVQISRNSGMDYAAKLEGGRLIHILPESFDEAVKGFSAEQIYAYECAFEADIFNMLAGPLAEACFVALCDGETINHRLVNLNALRNYGGLSELVIIKEYLTCLNSSKESRGKKMNELFSGAFRFVSEQQNWLAITTLADHLLATDKDIIPCDEIIAVLEASNCKVFIPQQTE